MGLYGDFDLQLGDNDRLGRYGGQDQKATVVKVDKHGRRRQVTVVLSNIHVAMLQSDLVKLGFWIAPHAPRRQTGVFDRDTQLAVREFQRLAQERDTLPQADSEDGPGYKRVAPSLDPTKPLVAVPQQCIYSGAITGVVDSDTRLAIHYWVTNWWRRPYPDAILSDEEMLAIMDILPEATALTYRPELNQSVLDGNITLSGKGFAAFLAEISEESIKLTAMTELPSPFPSSHNKFKGRGAIQLTGEDNYTAYSCSLSGVSVADLRAYETAPPKVKARMTPVVLSPDLRTEPELVAQPPYRFDSAKWFWSNFTNCNALAQQLPLGKGDGDLTAFDQISRTINGGDLGRGTRRAFYIRIKSLFGIE